MKNTIIALSLISLTFFSFASSAKDLTKLGERPSSCKNIENDDYILTLDQTLQAEAKSQFENDRLKTAIVKIPNCFRIGSEIQVYLQKDTIPYLGRGLIQKMRVLNGAQLAKDSSANFTKSSVQDYIAKNKSKQYAIITYKVVEKVEEIVVTEKYGRLNTCFTAYGDWKTIRIKQEQKAMVKQIQSGKRTANIWNGTFNCYKVGVYTGIQLQKPAPAEDQLGYIVPTELHLVHYTNLTQKHASLLGESLSSLKKRMAENKKVEGGYTTMVVFDYEKCHPKEIEQGTCTN